MSEIEFLDPVPPEADGVEVAERPEPRLSAVDALGVIPAVLWLAAAAVAVVAAFATVYRVVVDQDSLHTTRAVDAWGRFGGGGDFGGAHAVRYGIALSACAGVLLAAGVLASIAIATSAPAVRRVGLTLGAVGLGGCLAMAATMYLEVSAVRDTIAAELRSSNANGNGITINEHITMGTSVWLGIAASGCALLAIVAGPVIRRLTPAQPETEPAEPSWDPQPDADAGADPTEIAIG